MIYEHGGKGELKRNERVVECSPRTIELRPWQGEHTPPFVPMEKAVESPLLCRRRPGVDIVVAIPRRRRSCHSDAHEALQLRQSRRLCLFPEFMNCELESNHLQSLEARRNS